MYASAPFNPLTGPQNQGTTTGLPFMGGDMGMASARCGCNGMSSMDPMGGADPSNTMNTLNQINRLSQMNEMLMLMLMTAFLRQMTGAGGDAASTGASSGTGATDAVSGASGGTGGSSASGGTSDVGGAPASGNSGSDAVELGRRFLGRNAADIKGQLSHFTAAGGQTNNCADFVSSCLESTGRLKGHHVGVRDLESSLKQQGYRQVPAAQAKPGDVWISNTRSHTELVAAAGGTRTIGSNNDRPGHQVISERAKQAGTGVFYSKG